MILELKQRMNLRKDLEKKMSNSSSKISLRKIVWFCRCDVTKQEDLVALYDGCEEYFKTKVDIFCNNAGINTALGWRKCMDINIVSFRLLIIFSK